ncbi:MAG: helix-turn-helix transcriptional regulator [Candidatus Bathycorpusculaceae bacterium]
MRSKTLASILAVVTVMSIIGLFLFVAWGGAGGRGHGMGGVEIPRSFSLALLVVPLAAAVIIVGYALVFPELREEKPKAGLLSSPSTAKGESALAAVLRVLSADERKVVETLVAEGGTMLQKDIRWKTGLSRVKTHRTLLKLAKRGIVSVEEYYNTNKIALADWLKKEDAASNST